LSRTRISFAAETTIGAAAEAEGGGDGGGEGASDGAEATGAALGGGSCADVVPQTSAIAKEIATSSPRKRGRETW
jgi:hypothetical protein